MQWSFCYPAFEPTIFDEVNRAIDSQQKWPTFIILTSIFKMNLKWYLTKVLNPLEEEPFALQNRKWQDIFCLTLWSSLRLISSWYSETGEAVSLSLLSHLLPAWHYHQLCQASPLPWESRFTSTVARRWRKRTDIYALLLHLIFSSRCWSCYVCLGQALGLPRVTSSPPSPPTPPPTQPTTPFLGRGASLATMALPLSQALASATALDPATTSNGGKNDQYYLVY